MHIHPIPLRLAAGAFILNSGLSKRGADEDAARGMHAMAANAYPYFKDMEPQKFAKLLSSSEIALGAALLVPVLPRTVVAAGFTAFSGLLAGMYLKTPSLHVAEGDPRPNEQGVGIAKDVIMFGAALSFLLDSLRMGTRKAARKTTKKVAKETAKVGRKTAEAGAKAAAVGVAAKKLRHH
ncbi:hypothetical protein [Cellulomonas chengniuliangii]|uniref:DoxX family protein n=1 Tax=Cellulomonas chengniuliangii TaxID=2968084 RepID=A0ABY5KYW4_9CELL|nr:hypothetical protein [Cellulomonas chengniuliangii]MCC2307520.1 hypothetical protein [Cellulomonas chengniuliangii]MCC2318632.1 hypothetical protein [Cellulomonas chengniuliangii]UUI75707.1 hypothetical protein NP064_01950 [Cellulomonas chengniuliangii]